MTARSEAMEFTGRNSAELRAWLAERVTPEEPYETCLVTKGQSASTGGQAWRYVRGDDAWPTEVSAAVYDPARGEWSPLRPGDFVHVLLPGVGVPGDSCVWTRTP